MSFPLWKFFIQDDVDGFRQYLARATYPHGLAKGANVSPAGPAFKIGSPNTLATSPRTPTKTRKSAGNLQPSSAGRGAGTILTRADINAKDSSGRTLLHHAASSQSPHAADFVKALLEIPTVDLYVQDTENGWTALHRALYNGNIDIAQALLLRDALNATDFSSQARTQIGGLFKVKDHEGNSPFEVFGATIAPRDIQDLSAVSGVDAADDEDANSIDVRDDGNDGDRNVRQMQPLVNLRGDEAFAFGSNKNLSLGLGDEDDRHFPERIQLERPDHLLRRLYDDFKTHRQQNSTVEDLTCSIVSLHQPESLPAIIRCKPFKIQDIVMSKLHTAVLTDDPISNLHICGFGPGGRLGTGDETTRFNYVCIQGGGLASRRVSSIALGQDHCVAICSTGEVFTWGSNRYGQLGYVLPEVVSKEVPTQLTPRQLYGLVKKETVIGAAASSIHSVIYTASGLYAFGRNEGQLGLMDADARSLKIQDIPRRVGVSLIQSPIVAVSAIDRATTVLLENHDVIVFTHYGFTRVVFPLEESSILLSQSLPTRYSKEANMICKITSGGNTIGALSTFGQVFTVDVPKPSESIPSNVSTTNPNKARNALPLPSRIWSIRKSHMSAMDVAVGQDGSIILCTEAGSVWRKEKRTNIKSVHDKAGDRRSKDYKFVRVPNLTRIIAVRSNAFGAFAAVRKDCDVTREQISVQPPALWDSFFPLLCFQHYSQSQGTNRQQQSDESELRFWLPAKKRASIAAVKMGLLQNSSVEEDFLHIQKRFEPLSETQYDVWVSSNVTDVRIPVHSVMLKARSRVLRSALTEFQETYYFSIPDVMSLEYGQSGDIELTFQGADFLTLVNFVFYLYTETLVDVWHYTSRALHLAPRYRQTRVEVMRIASHLELRRMERAVRVMVDPILCMMEDFELAYMDMDFYANADVMIDLADGAERPAHSILLSSRCPFFEGLFHGRAAGKWVSSRRQSTNEDVAEVTRVDLKHVDAHIFDLVQRHIYADTGAELFDGVVSKDLDGFIDTVLEVMSVANELMLDRLAQTCQNVIGKFVMPRNVCGLLNTIAECSVEEFKSAALEYLCLNLETMLGQHLLEELDQYLLEELGEVVRENQLAYMPFTRSGRDQAELFDRHPDLAEQLEQSRQRRMDSMRLSSRFVEQEERPVHKTRIGSYDKLGSSPVITKRADVSLREELSPNQSPAIPPNDMGDELPFNMDEDTTLAPSKSLVDTSTSSQRPSAKVGGQESFNTLQHSASSRERDISAELGIQRRDSESALQFAENLSPPSESRIGGFELPKAAWKNSAPQTDKADLREIMEQASTSRVSNLTQAMNAAKLSRTPIQRMSQKERKRQLHEFKSQAEATKEPNNSPSMQQSPWTKVTPTGKAVPALSPELPEASASPDVSRPLTRPNMTMRQTVAGTAVDRKEAPPRAARSVSSTAAPAVGKSPPAPPPQIQSIRHTPVTTRSTSFVNARTSMSDILAQQLGEKAAIKEAVAKRSLQEIQQEQEFQEWWDLESKRVQEEEAAAIQATRASNPRAEKTGRETGRGRGGRRRGSGRGGASSSDDREKKNMGQKAHPVSEGQATHESGEGRARAHGRGRGRGKPRRE